MLEELDGLRVEWEVPQVLVVEEVDGVPVEVEGQGLKEGDVVGQDLLIREVQLQDDDGVDVVVGQQVVCNTHIHTDTHKYTHAYRCTRTMTCQQVQQ